LLALAALSESASPEQTPEIDAAGQDGCRWLVDLQNANGGWPTFCRGWGKLPFDRSSVDLTAHAIRALHAWDQRGSAESPARRKIAGAIQRGFTFLARQQRPDGSWVPLWFGNQDHPTEENPAYGTARVLLAYRDLSRLGDEPARRGFAWLAAAQNDDDGWGGSGHSLEGVQRAQVSSVEETAVATEALLAAQEHPKLQPVAQAGAWWLVEAVESGRHRESSPIGFYFAKLWYYERLYPLVFTVSALGQALLQWAPDPGRRMSRHGAAETAG
jgi:squalene-hopene/tetraprenyl-beta-curcumene cyclase